jgi:hypothetical protein
VAIAPQALAAPLVPAVLFAELLLPLLAVFAPAEVELAAVLEPPEQPIPADNRANKNKADSV